MTKDKDDDIVLTYIGELIVNNWISVDEELPLPEIYVLVRSILLNREKLFFCTVGYRDTDSNKLKIAEEFYLSNDYDITHWQHLPSCDLEEK